MSYWQSLIKVFGAVFVCLGIIAFINSYTSFGISSVFWFSNFALFLVGIGMLTKKPELIASQLNIIFIPYLFWNIDFFYRITTFQSLWGITDYFFTDRSIISQIITSEHIFLIPLAVISLYFLKLQSKNFWKISLVQVLASFVLLKILGDVEANINCVYMSCFPLNFTLLPYEALWIVGYIGMIFLTNLIIVVALEKYITKKAKKTDNLKKRPISKKK